MYGRCDGWQVRQWSRNGPGCKGHQFLQCCMLIQLRHNFFIHEVDNFFCWAPTGQSQLRFLCRGDGARNPPSHVWESNHQVAELHRIRWQHPKAEPQKPSVNSYSEHLGFSLTSSSEALVDSILLPTYSNGHMLWNEYYMDIYPKLFLWLHCSESTWTDTFSYNLLLRV